MERSKDRYAVKVTKDGQVVVDTHDADRVVAWFLDIEAAQAEATHLSAAYRRALAILAGASEREKSSGP